MKKNIFFSLIFFLSNMLFLSCKKAIDKKDLWQPVIKAAAPVSDAAPLCGTIKGTMLAGKTYTIGCNVIINEGDTLTIQEGVTINFAGNYGIGVKGTLLSLGTSAHPNYFTVAGVTKTDQPGANAATDPAFSGKWSGIIAATTCKLLVIKWTHIEYGGGATTGDVRTISTASYPIFFQNPNGVFVLEDSWLYGSTDDPIRTLGGKIAMFRNTFEKCGYTGGEALNAKAGTIGDFAYNVCIGIATNGPKNSNSGAIAGVPGSNIRMYNNTIINCGYRRAAAGRGGSINFEQDAGGIAYNNLIVNCKFGLRVVQNPIADTANLRYGYNFYYGDSLSVLNQIIPSLSISTAISVPQETDIPKPSTFLPSGWHLGDAYTAPSSLIGANNPQFISGPVPLPAGYNLRDVVVVGNFNLGLKPTSPCIGAGFTGFSPKADVPLDPIYGATEITPPGRDIGAYQSNGRGNQHQN